MTEAPAASGLCSAQELEGYAEDCLADGAGWCTFDVAFIRCPVTVLHGRNDRMVDVIHARHTAELIPGANLVIFDDLGHFSIVTKVVPAIRALGTGMLTILPAFAGHPPSCTDRGRGVF